MNAYTLYFLFSRSCPVCRVPFTKENISLDAELAKLMEKQMWICKCGQNLDIYKSKGHTCKLDEDLLKKTVENHKIAIAELDLKNKPKEIVNRMTFKCPGCSEKNFDSEGLLTHLEKFHSKLNGVCPICVIQPWGDPNITTNLVSHIKRRHKFDYINYTNYEKNEEEIMREVIEKSLKDC